MSPVPGNRLSFTGTSELVKSIDADQNTIEVASPEYFKDEKGNNLHTVKIGSELIRYKLQTNPPKVSAGFHVILIDSEYPPEDDSPTIEVQFKGLD